MMKQKIISWLASHGLSLDNSEIIWAVLLFLVLIIACFLIDFIAKKLLLRFLTKLFTKTKNTWDDLLIDDKLFVPLAHIFPAILVYWSLPLIFSDFPSLIKVITKVSEGYIIVVVTVIFLAFLKIIKTVFSGYKAFKGKPIDSYFQLGKIFVYIFSGIFVLSILLDRSPLYFLSAFGAMTAIVLLIFKDTILGFVASIQISANDMIQVNDWVQMDKYQADGDVLSINLSTVKIKNFDNTITTVPTYAFISDSFKNWRGMQEAGGRRIKRSIKIKISSIKHCDNKALKEYQKIDLLKDYINQKQIEIGSGENTSNDRSTLINKRNLTNIGLFRKYCGEYLKSIENIHKDMTLMIRQLSPTELGLPIEIYCFTNTTEWVKYEEIQSDMFDHLLAVIPHFELEVFELEFNR